MAILACVSLGAWMSTLEDGACLRVSSTINLSSVSLTLLRYLLSSSTDVPASITLMASPNTTDDRTLDEQWAKFFYCNEEHINNSPQLPEHHSPSLAYPLSACHRPPFVQAQRDVKSNPIDVVTYNWTLSPCRVVEPTGSVSNWSQDASLRPKHSAHPMLCGQIPFGSGTVESIALFVIAPLLTLWTTHTTTAKKPKKLSSRSVSSYPQILSGIPTCQLITETSPLSTPELKIAAGAFAAKAGTMFIQTRTGRGAMREDWLVSGAVGGFRNILRSIWPQSADAWGGVRADRQVVRGGSEVWVQGEFMLLPLLVAIYDWIHRIVV